MARVTMTDALRTAIRNGEIAINCCLPGRIESYDASTQKASVKPLLRRLDRDGTEQSRPIITNVPVVWPRAGGAAMTMPVERGDGVMVLFSDRSLDRWLSRGGEVTPDDRRVHDYSDAIAVPGLVPFADAEGHDDGGLVVGYPDGARAKLSDDGKVAIGNDAEELLALFGELLEALISATTATAIGSQPLSEVPTFEQIRQRLDEIKGSL